ncbi:MAG TPA: hypothetical protein VGI20_14130 [Rhizomicrobium sp.]|jgi:hypothetical protein
MVSGAVLAAAGGATRASGGSTSESDDAVLDLGRLGLKSQDAGQGDHQVLQSAFDSAGAGNCPVIVIPPRWNARSLSAAGSVRSVQPNSTELSRIRNLNALYRIAT